MGSRSFKLGLLWLCLLSVVLSEIGLAAGLQPVDSDLAFDLLQIPREDTREELPGSFIIFYGHLKMDNSRQ